MSRWRQVGRLLVGASWGQRVVVIGAVVVYATLAVVDPATARSSAAGGIALFGRMASLVVASLLLANALGHALPEDRVAATLGAAAGTRGVVLAGLLGGLLPGGPYAVYPIVERVGDRGASAPAVVALLVGYSAIGVGRVPFGLGVFGPRIVLARLAIGVVGTVGVAVVLAAVWPD
ncbi:hypothetical protein [Halococcoides cellulosivorans]|uniref:Permease n=1 Tax=Halococcoides cellulosivorans TaxID=1679096 RepID=A0A2R4X1I6_9EURY|nr:hypothetical protein [Halococcoides cellulosivorans]AWB27667.1 hypothetical protein HARCEL1_08065 [Halococcoides cellulosivorans]